MRSGMDSRVNTRAPSRRRATIWSRRGWVVGSWRGAAWGVDVAVVMESSPWCPFFIAYAGAASYNTIAPHFKVRYTSYEPAGHFGALPGGAGDRARGHGHRVPRPGPPTRPPGRPQGAEAGTGAGPGGGAVPA